MKYRNLLCAALLAAIVPASFATAQRTRQGTAQKPAPKTTTPAKPGPTPAPKAANAAPQPAPGTLAVVNGQPITLADLDPQVRGVVEDFDRKMPDLRRDAVEARINTLLLEAEAAKRKVLVEQLMDAEVGNIKDPTDAEVQAVYDANRQQIGNATLADVRPQIIAYLRNQASQKLVNDFIARLRSAHQVVMGAANVNAPNLAPSAVLATVDGRAITAGDFEERLKPFVYRLRREIFDAEARALDFRINQILLDAEAKKRNMKPEDVYKAEVTDKLREPTEAEVTKFYEDNKARIKGDLNSLRADIADVLKNQQLSRLEAGFAQRLRSGASVQVFLKEPEPPVLAISTDDDPSRGQANAPVTIVEFTDFQCPNCAAMQPVLDEVLKVYGPQVRLVVRDFPLSMHENARKAAEAAAAANAQGKFFEYIAVLFKNQSALDIASLKKYASDLGLDRARFDADLESGKYAAEVSHDVSDGEAYGVTGTPTIFINGVLLRNLTAEGLRAAIDGALARPAPKSAAK